MTKEQILSKLIPIIAASLDRPEFEIVAAANLISDLGADSLDTVQMATDIENKFDLRFTDAELEKISTVQDVVDMVAKNIPA